MDKPTIVVLSGGQDSTTCAFWTKRCYPKSPIIALTFDYEQRHSREIDCAKVIAAMVGAYDHIILKVGNILDGTSPLTNRNVELEQYPDGNLPGGLEKTFVPGRNALFMTLAANRAYCLGAERIVLGMSQEDYGGYPDCRDDFINIMEEALNVGVFGNKPYDTEESPPIRDLVHTPLIYQTKAESIKLAMRLPGCYPALAWTHTAYDGTYPPTGHDHATVLRAKGFEEAGVPDPLIIRAWLEGLCRLPKMENYRRVFQKQERLNMDYKRLGMLEKTLLAAGVEFTPLAGD